MAPESPAPDGSQWYDAGHHWLVLEQTTHDGEPAVRLRCLSGKRRPALELPRITRLLLKHGTRQS